MSGAGVSIPTAVAEDDHVNPHRLVLAPHPKANRTGCVESPRIPRPPFRLHYLMIGRARSSSARAVSPKISARMQTRAALFALS